MTRVSLDLTESQIRSLECSTFESDLFRAIRQQIVAQAEDRRRAESAEPTPDVLAVVQQEVAKLQAQIVRLEFAALSACIKEVERNIERGVRQANRRPLR